MCALEYTSIRDLTWNSYMTEEDMYNLIEFNVFPLESSTRLQERRFCYSSSKGERICGYLRKQHIHCNIPRNYGKLLEKFDEFPLKCPIPIVFEQGLVNGKIL